MLILTRRVGQTVMIGNDITVTVVNVKERQVLLEIIVPVGVAVRLEEEHERIARLRKAN